MNGLPTVYIILERERTRVALAERLRRAFPQLTMDGTPGPESEAGIVITSPADCSLVRCRELAGVGHRVLVVAPVPQPAQAQAYTEAGAAAYIPMEINLVDLTAAIASSAGARTKDV